MSRRQRIILAFLNIAGFLVTILINYFASTLSINGQTTGEVSQKFGNLFVPAGYAFAIWGIIYLLLAAYVIYQLLDAFRIAEQKQNFMDRIGVWFIVASIANSSWVFAWHYELIWLSVLIMLLLLTALLFIYIRLDILRTDVPTIEKYLVHLVFSVYLGWITVATIANISAWLTQIGWDGLGVPQLWAILMSLIATGLGVFFLIRRKDPYYPLVIAWALLGIFVARYTDTEVSDIGLQVVCAIGFVTLIFTTVWSYFLKRPLPFLVVS